ncbi:MAG: hypothetical protein ACLPWS_04220 [Rhodomicrobium sp.]
MFTIEKTGLMQQRRLVSDAVLKPDDFDAIADALGQTPVRARKISCVAACRALEPTAVETRWQGEVTKNEARPGDWIVTNLDMRNEPLRDAAGSINRYVIRTETFERLYDRAPGETEWGPVFKAKGTVEALELPGGLDIPASWGERQTIEKGYLLRNGTSVYGNDAKSFCATYEILP